MFVISPYLVDNSKSFFVTRRKSCLGGAQGPQSASAFADSGKSPDRGFPPWFSVSSRAGTAVKASRVIPSFLAFTGFFLLCNLSHKFNFRELGYLLLCKKGDPPARNSYLRYLKTLKQQMQKYKERSGFADRDNPACQETLVVTAEQ